MKFASEEKNNMFFLKWPLMVTKHNMLLVCELHIVDVYDLMNLNGKFNRFDLYLEPK